MLGFVDVVVDDLALPEYGGGGVIQEAVDEASSLPGGFLAC